jgi:uncharacterized protein involved in exopolysaccharide biosynthesis
MNKPVGLARVVAVIRRRKWPVAVITLAVAAAGLYYVMHLPPVWQARAVVRIDDPHPAKDYVAPIVMEPDAERLKGARLGFLATPVLTEAGNAIGMSARAVAGIGARLDARMEGIDTYVLTYEDADAGRARAFLGALTEAYTARRAREAAIRAQATAAFFDREVDSLRPRVAEMDARVGTFRGEHYGALPDQLDASLRLIEQTDLMAHTISESLDLAQGRRRDLIADIYSPLRHQEEEIAKDLSLARTRYTADSPEVKRLTEELERVRVDRESDEGLAARRLRGSAELKALDQQIAHLGDELAGLREREADLRAKVQEVAHNTDELARMTLDRDVLRDRLKILVGKQEEATLAAAMEAGEAGRARVNIVEPAWVGSSPVKPSRALYGMFALALAAMCGLGAGAGLDALDKKVRSGDDVRERATALPLAILGTVPRIRREVKNEIQ